jgi:putative aldouronate transport system substrate-binding protein
MLQGGIAGGAVAMPLLASATNFSKGFTLTQAMNDGIVDIVVGRRPFTDYEQIVKDWQTNGGEQIRTEYQASIAQSSA